MAGAARRRGRGGFPQGSGLFEPAASREGGKKARQAGRAVMAARFAVARDWPASRLPLRGSEEEIAKCEQGRRKTLAIIFIDFSRL